MQRTSCLVFLLSIRIFSGAQENKPSIKGHISQLNNRQMMLQLDDPMSSSSIPENHKLTIKGNSFSYQGKKMSTPALAELFIVGDGKELNDSTFIPSTPLTIVLSNSAIKINGNASTLSNATVTGSLYNRQFNEYKALTQKIHSSLDSLNIENIKSGTDEHTALIQQLDSHYVEISKTFIIQHPNYWISSYVLQQNQPKLKFDELLQIFKLLKVTPLSNAYGKQLSRFIRNTLATSVNKPAPPFTQKNSKGKVVSLTNFKGKVVLLDFWGSWCAPCIESFPSLKELYQQFHQKGFEIIGIANEAPDDAEKIWKETLNKLDLPWIQLLNNGKANNASNITEMYGVKAFPTSVVIDKKGKIASRFEGDIKALTTYLNSIFKD